MIPLSRRSLLVATLLGAAFVAGAGWSALRLWPYNDLHGLAFQLYRSAKPASEPRLVETGLATLEMTTFPVASKAPVARTGGGIDAIGNDVLVMSFRGQFYLYRDTEPQPSLVALDIAADNGYDGYREYITGHGLEFPNWKTYFRFIDVAYDDTGATPALWVTHHQWHDDEDCFTLRLSKLALRPGALERQSAAPEDWQTVYDTVPCLPLSATPPVFEGHRSGGRVIVLGPDAVLMSVGDHGYDGWSKSRMLPQDATSDYGKILVVDPGRGTARQLSSGHRNPQGLMVSDDGLIWSTEHGPRGGDELNLIADGGNYGWPLVTYGVRYAGPTWPLSDAQNRHDGYVRPVFAWLPSIGISQLIQVREFLPTWDGDLLVSSLKASTLHRLRYREGRVIFDEPIPVGERIRDIDQLADGTIVMWTNDAEIMELRPVDSPGPDIETFVAGLPLALRRPVTNTIGTCLECHAARAGAVAQGAPNLWGVYGRPIAESPFDGYSDALKGLSGRWDRGTLDAFLKNVQGFAQGSSMGFSGIADDALRSAVIGYLDSLRDGGGKDPQETVPDR
ncbi:MAG TPA: PQQ-dependent sugar dehydrogenase [Woeseiaceae bacterium]|nr:PQQ-dependent sugar dehydrogenase [Woeseiaceae bacterium]